MQLAAQREMHQTARVELSVCSLTVRQVKLKEEDQTQDRRGLERRYGKMFVFLGSLEICYLHEHWR